MQSLHSGEIDYILYPNVWSALNTQNLKPSKDVENDYTLAGNLLLKKNLLISFGLFNKVL